MLYVFLYFRCMLCQKAMVYMLELDKKVYSNKYSLLVIDTGVPLPFDWANLTAGSALLSDEVNQFVAEGAYSR